MEKQFKQAIDELIDILKYVDFEAIVHYVDLSKLRKKFSLGEPPPYKDSFKTAEEKKDYKRLTKAYREKIAANRIDHLLPLALTQIATFIWHDSILNSAEKSSHKKSKAYANFESLSGSDVESVRNYHRYKEKIDGYNEKIVGLNFHTKNSIDGGLELADIISYVSCQTLRFQFSKKELGKLESSKHLKDELQKLRKVFRDKFNVKIIDVTDSEDYKNKKS